MRRSPRGRRAVTRWWPPACSRPWPARRRGREAGHPLRVRGLLPVLSCRRRTTGRSPAGPPSRRARPTTGCCGTLNAERLNALFGEAINAQRASVGLPPIDNVRDHVLTDHPLLAADPVLGPWPQPADLDVVQTGAWILPDERPLPAESGGVPGRRHAAGVRGVRQHAPARRRTSPGRPSRRSGRRAAASSSGAAGPTSP